MDVIHVTPFFGEETGFGGISTASKNLCMALANLGISITVLTSRMNSRYVEKKAEKGSKAEGAINRIVKFPVLCPRLGGLTGLYITPTFGRAYKRLAPRASLIHFHGFRSYQNLAVVKSTILMKKPYVIQPHGTLTGGFGKSR